MASCFQKNGRDAGSQIDAEGVKDEECQADIGDEAECLEEEFLSQHEWRKVKKSK